MEMALKPFPQTAWEALADARPVVISFTRSFLANSSAASSNLSIGNLLPSLILGHNELAKTNRQFTSGWQSGNLWAFRHLQGEKVDIKLPSQTVHIDDCFFSSLCSRFRSQHACNTIVLGVQM